MPLLLSVMPFETLTKLLSSKLSEKYQLVSKFVNICNLEASEVCIFHDISLSLSRYIIYISVSTTQR